MRAQPFDSQHILGIPEIDGQHEQLHSMASSLREAIARDDLRHLVQPTLKRLHQLLLTHFAYEEQLMKMVNYPQYEQHKKTHDRMLKSFADYFDRPPNPADRDHLGEAIGENVLKHVTEHDAQLTSLLRRYLSAKAATQPPDA